MKPLTVFFGSNSSGKSSINQLLMLLKQTVESPDRKRVIHFGDRNSIVDVGTYEDMIFNHDPDLPLEISLGWTLDQSLEISDPRSDLKKSGDAIDFKAIFGQDSLNGGRVIVDSFLYRLNCNSATDLTIGMSRDSKGKYKLEAEGYNLIRSQGRVWQLPDPVRFYGFPDEAVAYYENTGFVSDFALAIEKLLGSISYLGPLRDRPQRTYVWSGEIPDHVGWSGDRAIEAMLASSERKISKGYKSRYRPFQSVIASWLRQMNLINHFEVKPIAVNRKDYEVKVQVSPRSPLVALPDVGFGISQILPVIVQCFYAKPESIIILEQPEIHLHPSVQAKLADLFVETISAREDGENRAIQLLIESHSEHFLRRLQRLIAEAKISPDNVAIYFCDQGPNGSTIKSLQIDMFGRISNWPLNFFGNMLDDVRAQTKSGFVRQNGAKWES